MIKTCATACFSLSFYFINAFRKLGKFYRERIKRKQTQRLSVMFCFRCQGGARLPPRQAHFLHSPLPYISPKKRTSPETLTKFAKRKNYPLAALPLPHRGFRGDTALATQGQGTTAQGKVRGMRPVLLYCIVTKREVLNLM